jgi:hypothetical protein
MCLYCNGLNETTATVRSFFFFVGAMVIDDLIASSVTVRTPIRNTLRDACEWLSHFNRTSWDI